MKKDRRFKNVAKRKGFVSFEGFSIDQPVVDKDICWTMDGDFVKRCLRGKNK